jgi:hypothetical protein
VFFLLHSPFANTFSSSIRPSNPVKPNPPQQATGLNKFKKTLTKGAAPKGQFKQYLIDANNVFYDDRPELK